MLFKIYLFMVYKFEGFMDVIVVLELIIGDVGSCYIGGILVLNVEISLRYSF